MDFSYKTILFPQYHSSSPNSPPPPQSPAGAREVGEHPDAAADEAHQHPQHPHQPRLQVPCRVHGVGAPEAGECLLTPAPNRFRDFAASTASTSGGWGRACGCSAGCSCPSPPASPRSPCARPPSPSPPRRSSRPGRSRPLAEAATSGCSRSASCLSTASWYETEETNLVRLLTSHHHHP